MNGVPSLCHCDLVLVVTTVGANGPDGREALSTLATPKVIDLHKGDVHHSRDSISARVSTTSVCRAAMVAPSSESSNAGTVEHVWGVPHGRWACTPMIARRPGKRDARTADLATPRAVVHPPLAERPWPPPISIS